MAHGGATEFRPRNSTMDWAAVATVACAVLGLLAHDRTFCFPAAMAFALMLQCLQRITVEGSLVQRVGLRPVVIDLSTAELVRPGASWWRELFFLAPPMQLRDADGRRLYLESWLWDAETRRELAAGATARSAVL